MGGGVGGGGWGGGGGGGGGGKETDKHRALSAPEDELSSKLKTWSSNLLERELCGRRDSTLTASCCETKLLKNSTAWDR